MSVGGDSRATNTPRMQDLTGVEGDEGPGALSSTSGVVIFKGAVSGWGAGNLSGAVPLIVATNSGAFAPLGFLNFSVSGTGISGGNVLIPYFKSISGALIG
jgi:hypothetical protein